MPRPDVVRRGSAPPPFWTRVCRRCDRTWSGYQLARRKTRHRRLVGTPKEKQVAFIFGCQRSGTNMVLRTLNQCLDVDQIEESDARGFDDCRILGETVRDAIMAKSTAKCVIFKPICDSHRARELYAEHADSKGIWLYRHFQDVANSTVQYWGDQAQTYIEDILQGGGDWGVAQWNREKVTDQCLSEIADAASGGLNPHGGAALFWYMRNRTFFEQQLEHDSNTALVHYEDLATDPAREFQQLCAFLGVDFCPDIIAKVFATSIGKRPAPPLTESIRALCDGMLARLDRAGTGAGETLCCAGSI